MKIGFVASQFGNLFRGGAEIQFENTYSALIEAGIDCQKISSHSTTIDDIDLIHFFKTDESFLPFANFLIGRKIPYVVSTIFFPETLIQRLYYIFISKSLFIPGISALSAAKKIIFLRNSSLIMPNTSVENKFIQSLCPGIPFAIVPNCTEDFYTYNDSSEVFLKLYPNLKGHEFVLNVGRIEPRKNQFKLIMACKNLRIPLVIIGQIRDEKYWKKCLSLNYNNLYYLGPIFNKSILRSAYASCKVFALPSTMETPGLTALEASFQCSKILITKNGGTLEYFSNSAVYVNPSDIQSITQGLNKLFTSKSFSDKGDCFNPSRYSDVAKQYIKIYRSLLN